MTLHRRTVLWGLALASLSASVACAQTAYPTRPIRMIVPYPPGSGTDFTAREVSALIHKALGQPVVIDNRPGAGATVGHGIAMKSAPDGYTLLLATTGGMVSGPALMGSKISYDPVKDFEHVGLATYVPYAFAITASVPAQTTKEFIELARGAPRKYTVASPGIGTPNHLGAAQLMTLTGIDLLHVPYKGAALAMNDVVSGGVHSIVTSLLTLMPQHRAGRIRVLGVGHSQRVKAYPEIPLMSEAVPGYYNTGWWGIAAPAGTPKAVVERLNGIMVKGLNSPEVAMRFEKAGLELATSTPAAFRDLIKSDLQAWTKLIKDTKITVDVLP